MSRRKLEMENLFNTLNRSLQVVWPDATDILVCPLCKRPFMREDIYKGNLSLEHVPPKSIKAVVKTITCTRCNNTIGTELQKYMVNDARRKELEAGVSLKKPFRAKVQMSDFQFDVEITSTGSGKWQAVSPLSILPQELKSLEAAKKIAGSKATISLKGIGTKEALDRAYLHSSYLALFSFLGYPYIAQPFMEEIRQKILNGRPSIGARLTLPAELKGRIPFFDPREKNIEVTLIGTAPDLEKHCFAVFIAGELVLMPFISDYYKVIYDEFNSILSGAVAGKKMHLPFRISLLEIDPSCKYTDGYVFKEGKRIGDFNTLRLSPSNSAFKGDNQQ